MEMHVSLSLVNSPISPETTMPRLNPALLNTLLSHRASPPARRVCFPFTQTTLSANSISLSCRIPGALNGAPMRANGNKPSNVGVIIGQEPVTFGYGGCHAESLHPPQAPFTAAEVAVGASAPAYCGSSPESRNVGMG